MALVLFFITSICVIYFIQWIIKRRQIIKHLERIPGPPPLPLIGNALEFLAKADLLEKLVNYHKQYGSIVKLWIGPTPSILLVSDQKFIEFILNSSTLLGKAVEYSYIKGWVGEGLLTNNGDARWVKYRKILTPAFYYNVLDKFIPVFTSVCENLVNRLEKEVGNPSFDISSTVKLYTLDTICECAMGTTVNALESTNCQFSKDVSTVCDILIQRTFNPFIKPDLAFMLSKQYRTQQKSFQNLNDTVNTVILQRKAEMQQTAVTESPNSDVDEFGKKKRLAFLDLLLEEAAKDATLTDDHIREEVATFMFAGHDTTQAALSFCIYLLAEHQDVQEKVVRELRIILNDNKGTSITLNDINKMKYMEAVIKESLRLYPPVPFIGRRLSRETVYNGMLIPKGMTLMMNIFSLHRDPKLYTDPLQFNPERFITGDISAQTYLPFSTGPRDCIGKKFGMIELKLTLAMLLQKFVFFPVFPRHKLFLLNEVVLTSATGTPVQIKKRIS